MRYRVLPLTDQQLYRALNAAAGCSAEPAWCEVLDQGAQPVRRVAIAEARDARLIAAALNATAEADLPEEPVGVADFSGCESIKAG